MRQNRTSPSRRSPKFAARKQRPSKSKDTPNGGCQGQWVLAMVIALCNAAGLTSPALLKGGTLMRRTILFLRTMAVCLLLASGGGVAVTLSGGDAGSAEAAALDGRFRPSYRAIPTRTFLGIFGHASNLPRRGSSISPPARCLNGPLLPT